MDVEIDCVQILNNLFQNAKLQLLNIIPSDRSPSLVPTVSALLKSIQHPIRRKILNELVETIAPIPYTEFLPLCAGSTGKLNYHLKILDDIIEKLDHGYVLSDKGKNIVTWLNNLVSEGDTNISSKPEVVFSKLVPGKNLLNKWPCDQPNPWGNQRIENNSKKQIRVNLRK